MENSKIRFCRFYSVQCGTIYGDVTEVIYESGRTRTFYSVVDVPGTVRRYIESAPYTREQYDSTFHRREYLYSHRPI